MANHYLDEIYINLYELNQIDGIEDIGMTTNGLLLKHGQKLYDAGLRRINVV